MDDAENEKRICSLNGAMVGIDRWQLTAFKSKTVCSIEQCKFILSHGNV
jgi:hypothetical protein